MEISKLGEFSFIKIYLDPIKGKGKNIIESIGDDCSILLLDNGLCSITTTDTLVENIHFIRDKISPYDLGYKSISVSLSDIAAMGGSPKYLWLSIAIPENIEVEYLEKFLQGVKSLLNRHDLQLMGGDTTRSLNDIVIQATIQGLAKRPILRKDAKVGDIVCLTGYIGDSGGGLKLLFEKDIDSQEKLLQEKHLRPDAHLDQGLFFSEYSEVHAMIDVSDGIASDLKRIGQASNVGFSIDVDLLPISKSLIKCCQKRNWDPLALAISAGEDYILLVTIDPQGYDFISSAFQKTFGCRLFSIGKVTENKQISFSQQGKSYDIKNGYDHFTND